MEAISNTQKTPCQESAISLKCLKFYSGDNYGLGWVASVITSTSHDANVKVTLEIEAEIPSGAPDNVVRTVTENSRTLKFKNQGFEKE
jgi:hypothetical protein